jgi:hypothetical protein
MKKSILFLLLCVTVLGSVGCASDDPIADQWTHNLYPDSNSSYTIGSNGSPYLEGHFTNLYATTLYLAGAIINGTTTATTGNFTNINVTNNGSFGNVTSGFYYGNGSYLTGLPNTSGFVPYTGATQSLNMGTNNITANRFTLSLTEADDIRIVPGSFDRPGISDPTYVAYNPNGGATATYLLEWTTTDIASFTVQVPHSYAEGTNLSAHIHWTAGARGVAESGKAVGWKVDYTWANMDGNFGNMSTINLSDVCDGTNHKHQMTPDIIMNGSGKNISAMLICNIKRTDTGADDTWVTNTAGNLPMLLEVDFHYQINTMGSTTTTVK